MFLRDVIRFMTILASWTLLYAAPFNVLAQTDTSTLQTTEPHYIGLSEEKLQQITTYLESEVEQGRIAGAVAMVARHGRIGYDQAVGHSGLAFGKPLETNALFRIASMTKAITSAAVMSLVEDGSISLDDPISKHLSSFNNLRVLQEVDGHSIATIAAEREPTIHDLLTHRSGFTYGWFGPEKLDAMYAANDIPELFVPITESLDDRVQRIANVPLKFQPGTAWDYGVSIDILGRIVEVASGLTLKQCFHERFFRPLKMRDTYFYVPEEKQSRLASLYTVDEQKRLKLVTASPVQAGFLKFSSDYCSREDHSFYSGGGGLVSTASDYLRFLQMLLNGGELDGARILKPSTVRSMTSNQIGEKTIPFAGHGDGFGFGFGVVTDRGAATDEFSTGTFSWGGIFNTYFWVDPQEQLIGVLMTQVFPNDHLTIRSEFRRMTYAAIDDSGFERAYYYEQGDEFANPHFNRRQLRVNAPEASVHRKFASRSESRSSGLARILTEDDLRKVRRVDLSTEIWGGHPGTFRKRLTVNGRTTKAIPEVGTASHNCTHQYPTFNLRSIDLVNGYNSLQFACDQGDTFWGHYIVDNAALRIGLHRDDRQLVEAELADFDAKVVAKTFVAKNGKVEVSLRLDVPEEHKSKIAAVHFQGRYFGFDENGNGLRTDWHGMTKGRVPYGWLGTVHRDDITKPRSEDSLWQPEVQIDASFIQPDQPLDVRALVEFVDSRNLRYWTLPLEGVRVPMIGEEQVSMFGSSDLPRPFWSRDNNVKECSIDLDLDPADILAAELHVVAWTGGPGEVADYFTLNGEHLPIADDEGHETVYSRLPIDPKLLRCGSNKIALHSDTKHHGIEILLPGPTLMVRHRKHEPAVRLIESAKDESAGGIECYCIETPSATYYLDKVGAGLSSMIDRAGKDWLGFHLEPGSGAGGEYRGFPNAVFKEAGNYFHARNSGTDPCVTEVKERSADRIVISAKSQNRLWAAEYIFTASACTFVMTKMPSDHKYWVLYEGTPGGEYDDSDWWISASTTEPQTLTTKHDGDLSGEWIAFGAKRSPRMLVLSHHENDEHPDHFYEMQKKMTVFGFGRAGMEKFLSSVPQHFSIGFVESTDHDAAAAFALQQRKATVQNNATSFVVKRGKDSSAKLRSLEQFALTHRGDAKKGEELFFKDQRTKCSTCHVVNNKGGRVGPDLTKIGGKLDRAHLVDSMLYPSKQIGYGYETNTVVTTDGKVISGIVTSIEEKHLTIVDASNKSTRVAKVDIDQQEVSKTSIMPTGLAETLTQQQFTDLVTYLETLGPTKSRFGEGVSGPITLPEAFELTTIASGLSGATALEVANDGRIFVCEQGGALRVVNNNKLLDEPFVTIPVEMNWERGLIGVTVAPNFPTDPHVYVVYVSDDPYTHHRVSRFRADGDRAVPGSEQILLRGDDQSKFGGNVPAGHQGGAIHFGPDGKIYIAVGEQTAKAPAQRMDALQGKVLRINPDGSIPEDNPFVNETTGKYQSIWAKGCRNPFTFAFNKSGDMLINDVGGKFEEINRGVAGANYGWPTVDHGPTTAEGVNAPIHIYPQSSINGGDFAESLTSWPERFQNKYFFADFVQGWVRYIDPKNPAKSHEFLSGIRRPVDLRFSGDGSLYILLRNAWVVDDKFAGGTSSVIRVRPK